MAVIKPTIYTEFRGVDYSASPAVISEEHASDMLNMYIGEDGVLQKRPGWHVMQSFEENDAPAPIYGIHFLPVAKSNGFLFVHAGTKLYYTMFVPQLHHIRNRVDDPGDVPFFKYSGDVPTASEASMILRYADGTDMDVAEWQVKNMDINGDGRVTEEDASELLGIIVGLASSASNGVLSTSYVTVKTALNTDLPLAAQHSVSFVHEGNLYLLDGSHYYCIKPQKSGSSVVGFVGEAVEGYIPTTGVNGHYEYQEPQTETTTGSDIVEKATVTLGNGESSADFTAVESIEGKRIFVSIILNSSSIANGLLVEVADGVTAFDVGYLHLSYSSGTITVTSNATPLTKGDKVTLYIKNEDEEVVVAGEPGSETNPGEWKKPEADEDRNLMQTKQINTFAADGIHKAYYLNTNACDINKVELFLWTRCKSVNGEDVPTQENIDHVDAGTYDGVYYYYKYIWTESYKQSSFTAFSSGATYAVGAKVKDNNLYYICKTAHTGAWNAAHFTEVLAWDSRDADSTTKIQNEISYTTRVAFNKAPEAHKEGLPNIRVTFEPRKHNSAWAIAKDRGYIEKCSIVTRFGYFNDNRYWFSGNPEHKSMDFMSAVDDPTYFPNTGWTKIGSDMTAIQGYLHYGSELAIIKEDNNQDATVYMRSAILTEDNNVIFPVQQGAQGVGAISKWCLKTLKDEPLFLAKEGVYAIQGTDASQERNVPNRSFFVDKKLKPEIVPTFVAEVFKDYYILCNPTNGHCWVADARYQDLPSGTNNRHHVYEWFPWDNIPASVIFATDDYLFFGTADGRLCLFNTDWNHPKKYTDGAVYQSGAEYWNTYLPYDGGDPIHAYYVTKRDHLSTLDFKKTMLNDGGVIIVQPHEQSSVAVTVTTDKGSWFVDQVFTDSDEPSVVIPIRKRFKNFDSIETRIENKEIREGLSILGLQYRYVITTNRR